MASLLRAHHLRLPTGQHISLNLARGEIHSLNGPSGVGKSRLLRILADLDHSDGNILFHHHGKAQFQPQDWRRKVMLVPTDSRWWLPTAAEHMARDMTRAASELHIDANRLQAPVSELSTGEKARCALLRALSRDPEVLLLDEPTSALDHDTARAVERLVSDYIKTGRQKKTALWVTHDELQAERVADHRWRLSSSELTRIH